MQEDRGYFEPTKDLETRHQQQPSPPPSLPPHHSPGRSYHHTLASASSPNPPSSFRLSLVDSHRHPSRPSGFFSVPYEPTTRGGLVSAYSGTLGAPEYVSTAYTPTAGTMSSYPIGKYAQQGRPQNQDQVQRVHGTLYDLYPSYQLARSPNDPSSLYSPPPTTAYYQGFPHSKISTASAPNYPLRHATSFHYLLNNRSVVRDRSYSDRMSLSLLGEPINMMNISLNNRRASLLTPVHVGVNNNNDGRLAMSTPQIQLSSIPMSNGSLPLELPSFIATASTHSAWSSPYPPSMFTSIPMTNLGHEVGSDGRVTCPPAPVVLLHSHSAPGNLQQYGLQDQTGTITHSAHPGTPHVSSDPTSISPMQENFQSKGTSRPQLYDPVTSARSPPAKKKKKSKMHECTVCGKEFPRPSGLHTHMNMHNNMKPYPCTYPGCKRIFNVRSNAKRHLQTHGISPNSVHIPTWTNNSLVGPPTLQNQSGDNFWDHPYVVGFSETLVGGNPSSSSSGIFEGRDDRGLDGNRTAHGSKGRKKGTKNKCVSFNKSC